MDAAVASGARPVMIVILAAACTRVVLRSAEPRFLRCSSERRVKIRFAFVAAEYTDPATQPQAQGAFTYQHGSTVDRRLDGC